jgi:hypothetical protein
LQDLGVWRTAEDILAAAPDNLAAHRLARQRRLVGKDQVDKLNNQVHIQL